MKNIAIYARVSTDNQNSEMQLLDLRDYSDNRKFTVYNEYIDNGISGSKEKRPALDQLMDDAKKKKFDTVLVWRFDRFARSTKHLVEALHIFKHLGIGFISFQENIDTSSPIGEAIFTIISAISQLERDIIRERILGGLRRAKLKGRTLGRRKNKVDTLKIKELRAEGIPFRKIEAMTGVPKSSVERICSAVSNNEKGA